jgi:hypothetical protein
MKGATIWNNEILPQDRSGRHVVTELILEHTDSISNLRLAIHDDPLYDPQKHDDLWLLRFVLSHAGKVKKAAKACKHTLLFRHNHELDGADIRSQPPSKSNLKTMRFMEYIGDGAFAFDLPDPARGVITYLQMAGLDLHGLKANVADEDVQSFFIYITEWCHQVCTSMTVQISVRTTIMLASGSCVHY